MPKLQKCEKVLVQYRLLKDFDELSRRGIPGIDVRVMEHNIYEWHVTMSPISGHFSGLRLHLILLFPEDYPCRPPKVELCTFLPHANVFRDFLTWAGYFAGYKPVHGTYVICTDLLEDKPPPIDPNDSRRYDGWSVAYSVESVLVQLQCLLFDDYVQTEDGNYINTLWDHWYSRSGEGRKHKCQVCVDLHRAQREADEFMCSACGYSGRDGNIAFYDSGNTNCELATHNDLEFDVDEEAQSDEDEEDSVEQKDLEVRQATSGGEVRFEDAAGTEADAPPAARKPTFTSRKKQRKHALQKQKLDRSLNTKVDYKKQNLYLEISNSNSALIHGRALRRVPGVFKPRDVVCFHFHGVPDDTYCNGCGCINASLKIFNYGHEVEFPWFTFDILTQRKVYHKVEPQDEDKDGKKVKKGRVDWDRFANSQGGGSSKRPADTPGTLEYIRQRETFHAVGVIEYVNPSAGTVTIVVAGSDGKMGASTGFVADMSGGFVTGTNGRFEWDSEARDPQEKATLYKNVPMEKVKPHGYNNEAIPYENEPPVNYRPQVGKFQDDKRVEYDVNKDLPVQLIRLFEEGQGNGLTKRKLEALPEQAPMLPCGKEEGRAACPSIRSSSADGRATERSSEVVQGQAAMQSFQVTGGRTEQSRATEQSFEIVSALGDGSASGFEVVSLLDGVTVRSFDIISVVEEAPRRSTSSGARGSVTLSSSFHVVPTSLTYNIFSRASGSSKDSASGSGPQSAAALTSLSSEHKCHESKGGRGPSDLCSHVSSASLLSLRNPSIVVNNSDTNNSWELLRVLSKLNVPIRGFLKSIQDFGAFVSVDATPRNLAIQNQKLLPTGAPSKGKARGKGKGKDGKGRVQGDSERALQDGLLPFPPYMRRSWPSQASDGATDGKGRSSDLVLGNVFDELGKAEDQLGGPQEVVVYVNQVEVQRRRLKLSLQPRLSFEDLRLGDEYDGIVVDSSKQNTLGLFVALSDDLVGLLHRSKLGAGAYADWTEGDEWYPKRCIYKAGDRLKVWVLKKEVSCETEAGPGTRSRRRLNIDLTMDAASTEVQKNQLGRLLQVLEERVPDKHAFEAELPKGSAKTAMDLQAAQTYDEEDKFFLVKNNRLIRQAEDSYPDLVIDYSTDPPPPAPKGDKTRPFDFSLIEDWSVGKISEEHKRITEKKENYDKADKKHLPKEIKPLSKEEERLLVVLQKKVEQWGTEYYEKVTKKVEEHHLRIKQIYEQIEEERDKYPYKSVIDLARFRELAERIKEKQLDTRCCFVTRLSYKEDVLGVGLEIKPESDTGRNVFHCSFDLLSYEGFLHFGIRTGVWKNKIQFWLPAAIDASHFRRALPQLAECFKQLGDGKVEKLTRSYGTQAGSDKYNLKAQIREAERKGQKLQSLDEYRKEEADRRNGAACPSHSPSENPAIGTHVCLTEEDVAYGLEVLPKLMNLQTVQLMKGDLHLSTKALEGYMGFHHLLLSILRQFPSLQAQVERKIAAFAKDEQSRSKKACPNIGEFLCLLAVSRKFTWDDVSKMVLKETLDRNASWAVDKFPVLAKSGVSAELRLEKTFKAGIVSIRLLCFNVWFLRNIVFKKYGEMETVESIVADKLRGGTAKNCVDRKWEEYEERKGIPKPYEVELLQEQIKKMMHGEGLNSWHDYFVNLNIRPLKAKDLSQLLIMSFNDAVRKDYIPLWKLRQKPPKEKAPAKSDYMGGDVDKFDAMFTTSGGNKW